MLKRHESLYSWRGKIGVIVPPTNTVNEAEWQMLAPEGLTIHTTRMTLHIDTHSEAGKAQLYSDIDKAVSDLAAAQTDCIAYGCTAGSMVLPVKSLPDYMSAKAGRPCVTTAASIVSALHAIGARRICLASPYHQALNEHEAQFLQAAGFDVLHMSGLGLGVNGAIDYPLIARTPAGKIYEHCRNTFRTGADALLIACTDFPVMTMISRLEDDTGMPVITSNQATWWAALRAGGFEDRYTDYGRLLRDF
ncbi:MAG: decarboxylase [Alphaproteobacteria bacterium]|nr:decarboxylase [Alphaproteobacteria bacterium]